MTVYVVRTQKVDDSGEWVDTRDVGLFADYDDARMMYDALVDNQQITGVVDCSYTLKELEGHHMVIEEDKPHVHEFHGESCFGGEHDGVRQGTVGFDRICVTCGRREHLGI